MADSATPAPVAGPSSAPDQGMAAARDISLGAKSLRQHTARGTILNAAFDIGLTFLGLLRGFVVAAFLTAADYGVWGILVVALAALFRLKDIGVGDKYIQQTEQDQELAFQKAFTLELLFTGAVTLLVLAAVPLVAFVYGQPKIVAPGYVVILAVPAAILQTPLMIFYRRMDFLRQRVLEAIGPVVISVVTIALAIGGFGYWSLVIGTVVGSWASALMIVKTSPYPLKLRYNRGTMREYLGFSWPIFVAVTSSLVLAQGSILAGEKVLGLAGAGAITLASSIALYTNQADAIVTNTLYPAICAVRDRTDLLFESFVKSNRLALMWGMPVGVGIALFAPDLVDYALGDQWQPAVGLIQAFGLIAAAGHIGFNWNAFFRARGETRPLAAVGVLSAVAFLAIALPLLISHGLNGFGLGMGIVTAISIALRGYFLTRLFDGFQMLKHIVRAVAPTVPAVAAVFAMRALESGHRSPSLALAELALYLAVTAVATLAFEGALLREVIGYLRRPRATRAEVPA